MCASGHRFRVVRDDAGSSCSLDHEDVGRLVYVASSGVVIVPGDALILDEDVSLVSGSHDCCLAGMEGIQHSLCVIVRPEPALSRYELARTLHVPALCLPAD